MADVPLQLIQPERSAREWCRLYMLRKIKAAEYAEGGGIFQLMRLADTAKSDIAKVQAMKELKDLAQLDRMDDAISSVQRVQLLKIAAIDSENVIHLAGGA